MARRGENIYKRKDGRWEGRYKCGTKPDGSVKYSSVYGKTYADVKALLNQKKADNSEYKACALTVERIFAAWFDSIKLKVKESTYMNYFTRYEKHILPKIGKLKFEKLTAEKINRMIDQKLTEGLSEKYVCDIGMIMRLAFKFAHKKFGCVDKSELIILPKVKKSTEKKLLSKPEQDTLRNYLLQNISTTNMGILLALCTGLRIGELCALKWGDIDLEKSVITVRHTIQRIRSRDGETATKIIITSPKSNKSFRVIPIPEFILPILKRLCSNDEHYILSGGLKPVEPRTMQNRFKKVLKILDLPSVTFHAIRHMFATKAIAIGFDVKTLSEILGHSSVKTTTSI